MGVCRLSKCYQLPGPYHNYRGIYPKTLLIIKAPTVCQILRELLLMRCLMQISANQVCSGPGSGVRSSLLRSSLLVSFLSLNPYTRNDHFPQSLKAFPTRLKNPVVPGSSTIFAATCESQSLVYLSQFPRLPVQRLRH